MVSKTSPIKERDINTRLTLIFTKIGQLDKAQEGIQELHEFLLEHPEYDVKVNAFLASAGTFFQKYLRKALAEITAREMKACGMLPDKKPDPNPNSNSVNKKSSHKFPSTSNRCSHSSVSFNNNNNNNNNAKVSNHIDNHGDSSSTNDSSKTSSEAPSTPIITLSPSSKTFMDKIGRETFDQTRSRLHAIFQYEKYKTGQKRSSLPNIHQFQSDSDRLEFAKSILQSKPRYRRSSWMDSSTSTLLPSNSLNLGLRS